MTLPKVQERKFVESADRVNARGAASLAALQKLTGELCFAQTAVAGRAGRAAFEPTREFITKKGGTSLREARSSLSWWGLVLPARAPRSIVGSARKTGSAPIRIYSAAAGEGRLGRISFFSLDERPLPFLLYAKVDSKLHDAAARSYKIYISEFSVSVTTVPQLRDEPCGRNVILFVDNEAARAALTEGSPTACLRAMGDGCAVPRFDMDGKSSDQGQSGKPSVQD